MVLFEKTCKCIKNAELPSKYDSGIILRYIKGREYQVDILADLRVSLYKVYQNGTYNSYASLNENEFNEYFEEIR